MLDERDLQAIAKMIGDSEARTAEKISDSEARTTEKFRALEASTAEKISASEARTAEKISALETRTAENISDAEARMMAMMEAYFDPKFNLLADTLKLMQERLGCVEALEDVEDRVDVLEAVVQRHSREIETLKKAQ